MSSNTPQSSKLEELISKSPILPKSVITNH